MVMSPERQAKEQAWIDLIEEQSESAPGTYLQEGEILGRGTQDGDLPAGTFLRVNSLQYKGYVEVWDTQTGDKSRQPWWLLWQTMRKRREDGSLVFTRTDPKIPPDYGQDLFCPLNPAAPPDQRFTGRGFRHCRKKHIPHWDALQSHIQHSHKRAWAAMERARAEREREEDRALQRKVIETQQQLMAALTQNAMPAPAPEPTPAAATAEPVKIRVDRTNTRPCPVCGEEFTGAAPIAVSNLINRHMKAAHPDHGSE